MFFIKVLFWLFVLVLILPLGEPGETVQIDEPEPKPTLTATDAVGAAFATVQDLAGICGRQPEVCEVGGAAWATFQRKALYGVDNAIQWAQREWLDEKPAPVLERRNPDQRNAVANAVVPRPRPARKDVSAAAETVAGPQNTLRLEDLIPQWEPPAGKDA